MTTLRYSTLHGAMAPFSSPRPLMRESRRSFRSLAGLALLLLTAAGCGKDAVPQEALDATIVQIGDSKLTGKQLETWLLKSPRMPNASASALIIGSWIDAALLNEARKAGATLDDSTTTDAAIGPDAARGMILEYWAGRAAARPPVTDAQADSLAQRDQVRVLQHFFLGNPTQRDSAGFAAVADRATGILRRAKAGEDFGKLVREASEDSATVRSNGFLPAISREDLPAAIRNIAWGLEPGAVSAIIPSGLGLHIVRRATAAESRDGLKAWLAPRFSRRADSIHVDSVTKAAKLTIAPDAVTRLRAMAHEPIGAAPGAPLATWEGGTLTPEIARSWIVMLQSAERAALAGASDSAVRSMVRELSQREIILGLAGATHEVAPKARELLAPQYRSALAEVTGEFARRTAGVAEANAASAFVDSLVHSGSRYRPLPGALAGVLRAMYPVRVDTAAIATVTKATQLIWAELHANDSTPPDGTPPAPGSPLTP